MLFTNPVHKAIAAFIVSALALVEIFTGWQNDTITETWILTVLMVLNPVLVWLIPNLPGRRTP